MTSETFISEFHNVEGVLIGERKHNLHKLLRNESIIGDKAKLNLDNLKPKTFLETLMYVDVLLYLRRTVQLMEILKNGNKACVIKIIKQPWFFKEAFNDVGAEELVVEILPSMSFSLKMKVLKKLSIVFPEEKMDEVFDAVLKRYGLFIAATILPACSCQKIEYVLRNNGVKLWPNHLKVIYSKRPDLIKIYFDVQKQLKNKKIFENSFLIYIAQNDPALFWYITEDHETRNNFKVGRRTTKKLIETRRHQVINEPKKYIRYFRQETLVRNLNKLGDFKQFYHNLFPRDIKELDYEYELSKTLLKYYPKHSQYQLYTETFSNVLNENILLNLSCLDDSFLKLIPDVELRETIAQLKYSEGNDDTYIQYYNVERCITLIKEKINLTATIHERGKLLCILVKSCAVNNDLKSLEKVLNYFCERHRNDDLVISVHFLDTVESNFKLDEFNEVHWKYLSEIITIQSLNNEFSEHSLLKIAYLKYLYTNNRLEDEVNYGMLEYFKHVISCQSGLSVLRIAQDYEFEKKVLMQALECFPTLIKTKMEHERSSLLSLIIVEIFQYNLRYPKNIIKISEKIVETMKIILETGSHNTRFFVQQFSVAVCKLNRNNLENEMLNEYWEKMFSMCPRDKVICWYLKYDPLIIVENIDKILTATSYKHISKIWPRIKLYSHLNLDNIVVKHCLKKLYHNEDDDKLLENFKETAETVRRLSILTDTEYYIKIMEDGNYIPTSAKLIIKDQKAKETFKIQQELLKHLKNLEHPLKYLPMLIDKFCRGDYLHSSLIALHAAFYRCPENELKPYLNKLSKNVAMSVKKHALYLACVFEQKVIFEILNEFEGKEKSSKVEKCIFSSCLKYFLKNPSEELFEKVIFHMGFLAKHDKESLKTLSTVNIPRNYKPSYIQHVLKLLENFKDKEDNVKEYNEAISVILDSVDEQSIQKLPQVYCREIIQKYFLVEGVPGNFSFIVKVLLYCDEKINNFDFVFGLLTGYKSQYWHDYSAIKKRENVYTFFRTFFIEASEKQVTLDFVGQFSSNWEKVFTPIETFEEYVLLNLLRLQKQTGKESELYSREIVLFSEKLIKEFGQIIFPRYVTILATSLKCDAKERIDLLSNMLKFRRTPLSCILVIELIVRKHDLLYKGKITHMYRDIDSVLKQETDPVVQLHYNLYLKT